MASAQRLHRIERRRAPGGHQARHERTIPSNASVATSTVGETVGTPTNSLIGTRPGRHEPERQQQVQRRAHRHDHERPRRELAHDVGRGWPPRRGARRFRASAPAHDVHDVRHPDAATRRVSSPRWRRRCEGQTSCRTSSPIRSWSKKPQRVLVRRMETGTSASIVSYSASPPV